MEHGLVSQVAEVDVLEGDAPFDGGQDGGVGKLVNGGGDLEEFTQADDRGTSLLQGGVLLDEKLDRREEAIEVEEEDDEAGSR